MKQNFTGYDWNRYTWTKGNAATLRKAPGRTWHEGDDVPYIFISEKDAQTVKMIFDKDKGVWDNL
jgi:hypothetical protein